MREMLTSIEKLGFSREESIPLCRGLAEMSLGHIVMTADVLSLTNSQQAFDLQMATAYYSAPYDPAQDLPRDEQLAATRADSDAVFHTMLETFLAGLAVQQEAGRAPARRPRSTTKPAKASKPTKATAPRRGNRRDCAHRRRVAHVHRSRRRGGDLPYRRRGLAEEVDQRLRDRLSGFSSAMWWPESMRLPRRSSAQDRHTPRGSAYSRSMSSRVDQEEQRGAADLPTGAAVRKLVVGRSAPDSHQLEVAASRTVSGSWTASHQLGGISLAHALAVGAVPGERYRRGSRAPACPATAKRTGGCGFVGGRGRLRASASLIGTPSITDRPGHRARSCRTPRAGRIVEHRGRSPRPRTSDGRATASVGAGRLRRRASDCWRLVRQDRRLVRASVAAHVRAHHREARLHEHRRDPVPGRAGARMPVHEKDCRPGAPVRGLGARRRRHRHGRR